MYRESKMSAASKRMRIDSTNRRESPRDQLFSLESVEALRSLFARHRPEPNARNFHGDTPLLHCIKNYRDTLFDKIEFLLQNGADPNIPDPFGIYPLQVVPCVEVLRLLLSAKARTNLSMHRVVATGCPLMLELLLKSGMRTHANGPNNTNKLLMHIRNVEQLRILEKFTSLHVSHNIFISQVSRVEKIKRILAHSKKLKDSQATPSNNS